MSLEQQLLRWRAQLLAQKKKAALVFTMAALTLLLWGRLLLKEVPRTATARPSIAVQMPAAMLRTIAGDSDVIHVSQRQ